MRCDGFPVSVAPDMTGYARGAAADFPGAPDRYRREARPASLAPKDYSVPLHVDCSIEYELPDCAKPPQGVKIEPLLMIHPSHFRRLESMRRVPFVNNLPRVGEAAPTAAARAPRSARAPPRRCCRAAPAPAAPAPALPAAAEYRLLLDDLLAHESRTAVADWRERPPAAVAAAVPVAAPDDYGAAAYRFESYPEYGYEGELSACGVGAAAYKASLGKYPQRQRSMKVHPYLAPEPPAALNCDISHATGIQGSVTAAYDRFDKRKTLPQLPIYM